MRKNEKIKNLIRIKKPDGKVIYRAPKVMPFGNFQMIIVRVDGNDYIIGDGDEYIRDEDITEKTFTLGKKLTK